MFLAVLASFLIVPSHALKPIACYTYKKDSVKLEWTAFKFTEKVGVKGTFKQVDYKINGTPQSVDETIASTTFEIDSKTVDTGNVPRDTTLSEHFFKIATTTKITGKVLAVKDGTAKVELTMNGVKKTIDFKVQSSESKIAATGHIDVLDFGMEPSMKKINESCHELHRGTDGVSKTWSTVDISITAEPVYLCKKKG